MKEPVRSRLARGSRGPVCGAAGALGGGSRSHQRLGRRALQPDDQPALAPLGQLCAGPRRQHGAFAAPVDLPGGDAGPGHVGRRGGGGEPREIEDEMQGPVPTATARDFEGAKPLTATPTQTPIPTHTPTPTATSTRTPGRRRRRPRPATDPRAAADQHALGRLDTDAPDRSAAWTLNPVIGRTLTSCTFRVNDLRSSIRHSPPELPRAMFSPSTADPCTPGWVYDNIPLERRRASSLGRGPTSMPVYDGDHHAARCVRQSKTSTSRAWSPI